MLKRVVQLFIIIAGGTIGFLYLPNLLELMGLENTVWLSNQVTTTIVGAIILYLITFWSVDYIVDFLRWVEETLVNIPVADLLFGSLGLILGLIVAYLVNIPLTDISIKVVSQVIPIFLTAILGYLGFQVGFKRRDEFISLLSMATKKKKASDGEHSEDASGSNQPKAKILDTSVIIDGRIADICQTHFLEGTVLIPQFVLEELQHIADSSDVLKRNRGRRGLDVLNRMQKEIPVNVEIYEGDFEDIQEVDSKLVKLAKLIDGVVVTNDFNLNKVCEFQHVQVLNINDLANAVKPVVLPGEELTVHLIKDGKEQNQGVAYLDDGTMIVVEEGKDYIGQTIEVLVTSVLQTSAGRMIFAKPKLLEKAL
ncbi:PIN/TRAM domain-containing protein [Pontibacillus salicampi]|uniref:PIN/TRAM domain-containing protein n=1 Tax=Pontibacillus salicampi TaxID=1449801 RepID=A0ABV6LTE1_9BACI